MDYFKKFDWSRIGEEKREIGEERREKRKEK